MRQFANTCAAIAATTKKLQKTTIVAEFLKSVTTREAAIACVFLSGRPFPAWEESTLQVGGRSLWQIVAELAGKEEGELTTAYRQHGDLGAVAAAVLPNRNRGEISLAGAEEAFRAIVKAKGPSA